MAPTGCRGSDSSARPAAPACLGLCRLGRRQGCVARCSPFLSRCPSRRPGYADGETDSAPLLFLRKSHPAHTADSAGLSGSKSRSLRLPRPETPGHVGALQCPSCSGSTCTWGPSALPAVPTGRCAGTRAEAMARPAATTQEHWPHLPAGGAVGVTDCADLIGPHQGLWKASLGELCVQPLGTRRPIPHRVMVLILKAPLQVLAPPQS